jgi:endosialidase-like protein
VTAEGQPAPKEALRAGGVMRHQGRTLLGILLSLGALLGLTSAAGAAGEAAFVGLSPCRLVDTRGNGFAGPFGLPALVTALPRDFPLQGQCGIPAGALAVSLNVTATNTQGLGFLMLYPQGGVQPLVSTLNYVAAETVANAAIVPLGPGGLTVVAGVSGADLVLDVNGYFDDSLVHDLDVDNLFVGVGAGNPGATGDGNTAVGARALAANSTGANNVAVGRDALVGNVGGINNIAIGRAALADSIDGIQNIAIGAAAGAALTSGSGNIYIGSVGLAVENDTLRIGSGLSRAFIAGIAGQGVDGATDAPVLVDANHKLGTSPSSRRVKQDIADMAEASQDLRRLRPVTFRYRPEAGRGSTLQYGLIAEEVAEVYPELVVRDGAGAPQTVKYHVLPALLLNELQRQARMLAEKDQELQAQRGQLAELAATVAALAAAVARLEGQGPVALERD